MPRKLVSLESTSKNADGGLLSQPQDGTVYGSYLYWKGTAAGGVWASENNSVHLGAYAGAVYQGSNGVAIGAYAGSGDQGANAVAIGAYAGSVKQGINGVAIGTSSGLNNQASSAIAIGEFAGSLNQKSQSIAIGSQAGYNSQGYSAIAIGKIAGNTNQSSNAIAIGGGAGAYAQGINAVAIGQGAGAYAQGSNAVAIGYGAGATSQASNSIILNASSVPLNASASGFFVSSVQGPRSSSNVLSYNTTTNEIFYNGSSERYKYDIATLSKDTSVIYGLQPREFKYKMDDMPDIGLIAEEAFKCDPSFAYLDKDQNPEGIQWNVITTYLVAEFKKLKMELDDLVNPLYHSRPSRSLQSGAKC